ncbi:MAG: hypothetical protein II844_06160 [Prevotella sp.]|nr:hypothetical protein [Prevotella sp.]
MKKHLFILLLLALTALTSNAQRKTDPLDRGLVAVKVSNGVFVSWRQQAEEYYDVTYNLYRNGTKINSEPLTVTNFTDASGTTSSTYTVSAVVKGVEQAQCAAKSVWANDYLEITPQHPADIHSTLVPNDACAADVDGDGQVEILLKYDNQSEVNNAMQKNGWYNEHTIFEVMNLDGSVRWWVNCGPNMGDFQNNEQNIVGYDWDQDGKAEVLMRLEEGSTIHMSNGTTYQIGADGQNGTAWTNYREPRGLAAGATTVALAFGLPNNATATAADDWVTTSIQNGVLYATTTANETEGDGVHATGRTTTVTVNDGTNETEYSIFQLDKTARSVEWFTHYGKEFLVYCNGETGEIYDIIDFPCARLESGETDLSAAWGDGYGHRSSKYFYGAPYLDGRNPSIFVGRGIYTRHKFVALDVNKNTHKLSERWRWMNNSNGPWKGQGYHNYAIVDVDWDGRDEIVWGSMVIDDNGMGLSTTGLGHGDSQHHGDLNPYVHGQEGFFCNEDNPGNNYRDLTTSKIYYRFVAGRDDGRAIAGNFSNDIPGSIASSSRDSENPIGLLANEHVGGYSTYGMSQNFRCYWDGDLCEETFDGTGSPNYDDHPGGIYKFGVGQIKELTGSLTNNWTKATPCYMGDILGDWREEFIMRTAANKIRIYTTTIETPWRNYSLWYDHQYRNAMVWQMCGYNQTPHVSYFLGEMEGITAAPPALTMAGRTEIANGGTITTTDNTLITCETNDMTVNVANGASPYIYIDNAPSWVQGSAPSEATSMQYDITYKYYTHTLTGSAFTGNTRIVKQGDGTLKLPDVTQTYNGNTDVWGGALAFNGTMQNSPLWMNRHTALYTAGTFNQPVTMEYGSRLYISETAAENGGSPENVDYQNATFKTLNLHEGARVVFDINKTREQYDKLTVENLNLRKTVWEYGPEYVAPVFEVNSANSKISVGTYPLCDAENISGDISDIAIESATGFASNTAQKLENVDGTIYLNVTFENEAYIGSKNNISSIWTEFSPSYTLEAGNSCEFKFTNYGGKNDNYNWILAAVNGEGHSTVDRADYAEYFSFRADGVALAPGHSTTASNVTITKDWTDDATFVADMAEADVNMTVTYSNAHELNVTAVITSNTGNEYNLTATYTGCSEDALTLFFTVDHSHMTYPEVTRTEAAPQVKMTYVNYNDPEVSYGEVETAETGFNSVSNSVGFANTGWGVNFITYMQVDLSEYKGKDAKNVLLTFDGSGAIAGTRAMIFGVGYNTSTWSSDMTYNTADKTITVLGDAQGGTATEETAFDTYTFDITNAFTADADGVLNIIAYATIAGGAYIQNPSVSIIFAEESETVSNDPTNIVNSGEVLYQQDFETASTIDEYWSTSTAGRYASEQKELEDGHYSLFNAKGTNGATLTFSALPSVGDDYTTASGYSLDFDFAVIPTDGNSSSGAQSAEFRILDTSNTELCLWKVTTQAHTAAANSTGSFSLNRTETGTFTANLEPYWYHVNINASADGTFMTVTDKAAGTSEKYTINENLIYVGNLTYGTGKDDGGLCLDNITLKQLVPANLTLSSTSALPDYEEGIYSTVTVDRNFKAGYSTLCLPFNMSVEKFTGGDTEAYVAYLSDVVEGNGTTKLLFTNTQEIEANMPCIIYLSQPLNAPSFSDLAVHKASAKTTSVGSWTMTGNYTPGFSMYGKYGVANNAKIMKGGSSSTLNALSAYITGPAAANAKLFFGGFFDDEEEATGISDVNANDASLKNGKFVDDKQIVILHNGRRYYVGGTRVK